MKAIWAALALVSAGSCDEAGKRPLATSAVAAPGLALTGRVVDTAQLIDGPTEEALVQKLQDLEVATSDQVVVVSVPSLEGRTIEQYGLTLGRAWAIGRSDLDNGVIVLLASTEQKVRVEVGRGLEGLLTDAKAGEVVRAMTPHFQRKDFGGGVMDGVDRIDRLLRSDRRRPQYRPAPMKEAA